MLHLEFKELELFFALLLDSYSFLSMTCAQGSHAGFKLNHSVLHANPIVLLLFDLLFKITLTVFSLELLAHGEGYSTVVERHVGSIRLFDIITYTKEQQTALRLIKCHLADDFIEALGEQLFANGAESCLTCLSLKKFLVKHLSETGDINS